MALNGPLQEFPLNDIISLVELGKQTGAAEIRSSDGRSIIGRIYFRSGSIIHAEMGGMPAEEALFTMFTLTEGHFEFINNELPPREEIKRNNAILIMTGINRADEYKKIKEIVPSMDLIPLLAGELGPTNINLTPDEWKVLTAINGKDNLDTISRVTRLGDFRTSKAIAHLLEQGVVEKKQRNVKYILYAELDTIATSHLGNAARNLLEQSYQRARLKTDDDISYEQALEVVEMFRKLAAMLMGPGRAKTVAEQMAERVRVVYER